MLAIAFNSSNISPIASSKFASYSWIKNNYVAGSGYVPWSGGSSFNANSSNWRIGLGGYSVVIPLEPNGLDTSEGVHVEEVTNHSAYMYFDVQKSTNVTLYALDAYGSYRHAKKTYSFSELANVILDTNLYNIISFADNGIDSNYDNMRKTHAQVSGISW